MPWIPDSRCWISVLSVELGFWIQSFGGVRISQANISRILESRFRFVGQNNRSYFACYYFSNKMILEREFKDAKMSSFSSDFPILIINELEEYGTIQAFRLVMKNYPHYLSRPEREKYFAIKRAAAYGVMFLS